MSGQTTEIPEKKKPIKRPPIKPPARPEKRSSGSAPVSIEEKVFGSDLPNVPTTLEQAMAMEGDSKNSNEVLGVLVEAHMNEADAILGRTFLRREDVAAVTDCLLLARHGIGGKLSKPMPWLSKWVLDKLRALPSLDGKSREQFVTAWRDSRMDRMREDDRKQREKSQGFA